MIRRSLLAACALLGVAGAASALATRDTNGDGSISGDELRPGPGDGREGRR